MICSSAQNTIVLGNASSFLHDIPNLFYRVNVMEINMPIKDTKIISTICKTTFFVLILNPQNIFLILEERLSLDVQEV